MAFSFTYALFIQVQESTSLVQDREDKLSPVKESAEGTLSSVSSSQLTNTPEEQLSQWKEEGIKSFFKVAIKASREAAIACLSHCKWNQEDAISYFFGDYTEAVCDLLTCLCFLDGLSLNFPAQC